IKDGPKWLQSIVARAFTVDPDERITMGEFVELIEGGIVALKHKMAKSNNATVETPQLTEEVMREITGGKKKRFFGKVATLSLLGVLVLIAVIVGSVYMFGGSDEPEQETKQVDTAPMNIEPTTMASPKVVKPVLKRARARPKPASLSSPPKGHVMPSDDYIDKLLKEKLKWCLQNGYRRRTYGKSLTNYLGCMRKRVNDLYYTKHRATAILLLDSIRPYFCFYPATKYDSTLRAECKRIKKDNKRYFKFVSALQGASYNKRLTARMPIRNRIRRERRAWFEKKYNLKSKPK
ncbi:MAG: hypothetical protein KAV87_56070, partial [Desulfobacteraceae bacterium]|nr:hypothetical protein [Desulfobacteraceae bacterium]